MLSLIVDGITFEDIPCGISRVATITPSEISGMLLDKTYFNDVIGTFMQYTVNLVVPVGKENDYAYLYEILTDPVDAHSFTLPYNQTTIDITGRVDEVSDSYYREESTGVIWRGTKFKITANHPSKEMTLDEVVKRGISPVPEVMGASIGALYEYTSDGWVPLIMGAEIGDLYEYTATGWIPFEVEDADEKAY